MMGMFIRLGLVIWLAMALMACNETKSLSGGQLLLDGSTVRIKSTVPLKKSENKALKNELDDLLRPKPNSNLFGIRWKLWFYNIAGQPRGKGLRFLLRNKLGEPPVLASYSALEKNRSILQNRLENLGFFKDSVQLDTTIKKKKLWADYTATVGPRYIINKVSYPEDSDNISREIRRAVKRSLLKPGNPYDLNMIKNERVMIDNRLKQRGFYYFNADNLLAIVDSAVGDHRVNIKMVIKKTTPAKAKEIYYINDIVLFADYDIKSDTNLARINAIKFQGYTIVDPQKKLRPIVFSRALVFKSGDIYNRKDHDLSLNRLISLGVFKFVKLRFEEVDTARNRLNAFYYVTPAQQKSIRLELTGLTKSNSANGGQLSLTWRNKNLMRGAELFTAAIYGGLETQFLGQGQSTNITKAGIDLNLYVPRVISAFRIQTNGSYIPKTRINLGYEFLDRSGQYRLSSLKTSFGYQWKQTVTTEHQLNIITINYVDPSQITAAFQQQLDTNITLARSIERQFIIGPNYNFNVNTQARQNHHTNNFYFNANIDLSGNLLGLITGADLGGGKQRTIFNTPFSQYLRGELDFRHYLSFSPNTILVSRITGGIGYAYGNSLTMPFIKEFFVGGANDIRAFSSRSLGPGTYYAGKRDTAFLPDQPGDIKMEMNAELRFKLFSVFRWAFFADAGNIWTLRTDSARPGSKFSSDFLQQVAMGIGAGLRVDISLLVLRLDLAIPVREPFLPTASKWIFDSKNLVWNFAIGYPF